MGAKLQPALASLEALEQELWITWSSADRIWIGTRLLGGMSAGFGLRVLLPTSPAETIGAVLAGWAGGDVAKRAVEATSPDLEDTLLGRFAKFFGDD